MRYSVNAQTELETITKSFSSYQKALDFYTEQRENGAIAIDMFNSNGECLAWETK